MENNRQIYGSLPKERRDRLMRQATYASVSVAAVLILVKTLAYWKTDSVSILGSLIDSFLDAGASIVNMIAVRHALVPADKEHRFGHGKAESLAGLFQAAFIAGSGVFLMFEAANRALHPQPIEHSAIGIWVMGLSIVLTFALVVFQRHVVRHTASVAISADSLHYKSDLLMNAAIILAILLATTFGWTFIDPLFAAGISLYLLWGATEIIRDAFSHLMDKELPDDQRDRIRDICVAHPEVHALHDLRTRSSGTQTFIQLHLEMDGYMTLLNAHEISDEVEAKILAAFPGAEVIIHQDPQQISEELPDFTTS